ncbi:MAG TPA: antitoxin family protein [Dehalococcoidia bacterium]|nr:antitoxin family protein [Dehalococcoidia bacterium]
MAREIRARFSKGLIEPLERVDLTEGEEITITIREKGSTITSKEALANAAGAWKGTLDFEAYLKDLYASRRRPSRDVSL